MDNTLSGKTDITLEITDRFEQDFPHLTVITSSVTKLGNAVMFLVKVGPIKRFIILSGEDRVLPDGFSGKRFRFATYPGLICELSGSNAAALRSHLPHTAPVPAGNRNSFGFGDRLGNAGAAHLRSLEKSGFFPILAQQSIREMERTNRTAIEVIDAASWAVFEQGYISGFGADADHLKTTSDIDRTISAGFTMFTIDPGEFVDNRAVDMNTDELNTAFEQLPWQQLDDSPREFKKRYTGRTFELDKNVQLHPTDEDVLRAAVKYGRVIVHTKGLYRHLAGKYPDSNSEVELSVDETTHPTTPEEHLIIASELQRLKVELVGLAPRFCGDFEKGIDFKGDIEKFREEYILHQAIARKFGNYKLSIHSGSDKFQIYAAIGQIGRGTIHVKTAGTSYLEALRAVSLTDPSLFREIAEFAVERFETDRKSYHISARTDQVADLDSISAQQLPGLLNDNTMRQVFHVTFGSVLTAKDEKGKNLFRDRLMNTLAENEEIYTHCLYTHFRRHLEPFEV